MTQRRSASVILSTKSSLKSMYAPESSRELLGDRREYASGLAVPDDALVNEKMGTDAREPGMVDAVREVGVKAEPVELG